MKNKLKSNWVIRNRKASFDYFFLREFTAGMQLLGPEVKQIRAGKLTLTDSYCYFDNGELYVKGMNIPEWQGAKNYDPVRVRKLLLKRTELNKLEKELEEGMTIIISKVFTNERDFIKAEVILARGKKNYDKRNSIKEKEIGKQIKQANP
jgi:SsrA-binding protein